MPTDAEKQEIAAEVAIELGEEQPSTAHAPTADEAPRGNVHGEEDDGDLPDDPPPPHRF